MRSNAAASSSFVVVVVAMCVCPFVNGIRARAVPDWYKRKSSRAQDFLHCVREPIGLSRGCVDYFSPFTFYGCTHGATETTQDLYASAESESTFPQSG